MKEVFFLFFILMSAHMAEAQILSEKCDQLIGKTYIGYNDINGLSSVSFISTTEAKTVSQISTVSDWFCKEEGQNTLLIGLNIQGNGAWLKYNISKDELVQDHGLGLKFVFVPQN